MVRRASPEKLLALVKKLHENKMKGIPLKNNGQIKEFKSAKSHIIFLNMFGKIDSHLSSKKERQKRAVNLLAKQ